MARGAWQRLVELAVKGDDAGAAAEALVGLATDDRTGEEDTKRAGHLFSAARILRQRLAAPGEAAPLLERAIALDPDNDAAFEELAETLAAAGAWQRLEEALRRRLEARRGDAARVMQLLADLLFSQLDRPEDGAEVLQRLLERAPEDRHARLGLARYFWQTGNKQESARHYERLLESAAAGGEEPVSIATAEAHLRLGQWARVVGRMADANRHLGRALRGEPQTGAAADLLVEVMEAFGRTEELCDLLVQRRASAPPEEARAVARALGGVLERVGRPAEAVALYRGVLDEAPGNFEALQRMAEIHRREPPGAELAAVLETPFAIARGTSGGAGRGGGGGAGRRGDRARAGRGSQREASRRRWRARRRCCGGWWSAAPPRRGLAGAERAAASAWRAGRGRRGGYGGRAWRRIPASGRRC